jgi:hypothetical protein
MSDISVVVLIFAALAAVGNFASDTALSPSCKAGNALVTICR